MNGALSDMARPTAGSGGASLLRRVGGRLDRGHWLLAPALVLLVVGFLAPVVLFLLRGVQNGEIVSSLPATRAVMAEWSGDDMPPEAAFTALAHDLSRLEGAQAGELARRMNFLSPGYRSLIMKTVTRLDGAEPAEPRAALGAIDRRWSEPAVWALLRQDSGSLTPSYFLAAVDLARGVDGRIAGVDEGSRIFVSLFARTLLISLSVTLCCLLLGFPAAWFMASAPAKYLPVLMALVLLPFWTSTLVRSTAWVVLLQDTGLINRTLQAMGLTGGPLPIFANRFAVVVAMSHVLLPYMILPLYGVIKTIRPELMRACASLGANPWRAFLRVYLPLSLPGVGAGSLLVFILALGYYITPALVGGPADQMVSHFIALYTNQTLNWGLASALSTLLLLLTFVVFLIFRWLSLPGKGSAG